MFTKTIAKNRKKFIDEIFAKGTGFLCFSLDNYFRGTEVSGEFVKEELFADYDTKLRTNGEGRYKVRVHSNLWYEFSA